MNIGNEYRKKIETIQKLLFSTLQKICNCIMYLLDESGIAAINLLI